MTPHDAHELDLRLVWATALEQSLRATRLYLGIPDSRANFEDTEIGWEAAVAMTAGLRTVLAESRARGVSLDELAELADQQQHEINERLEQRDARYRR